MADGLDTDALRDLYGTMRDLLESAIACGAGFDDLADGLPSGYLLTRRSDGTSCPRCLRPPNGG